MGRPRNINPPVRRRKRAHFTELRVWYADRWHRVGILGDPPARVQERIAAVVAGAVSHKRDAKPIGPEGLTIPGMFAAFLRSPAGPGDRRDRDTVRRTGLLLGDFHGGIAASLTAQRFEAWRDWLCTLKAHRGDGGKSSKELQFTLSHQYIRKLMAWARRAFTWSEKEGLIPPDVSARLSSVTAPMPGKARRSPPRSAANPKDVDKLLKKLPPEAAAMLTLIRFTGMRPGEVCRIRPGEVHRRGVVSLEGGQAVDLSKRSAKGCWLYLPAQHKTSSRGKPRIIALPRSCHEALSPFLVRDPCFTLTVRQFWKAVADACRSAKVPRVTPYSIRHLVGAETARAGGLHAVMQRLGHSNPQTAARYVGVDLESVFKVL